MSCKSFSRASSIYGIAALAAVLCVAACGPRAPKRAIERLAVLPFENHSANPTLDWVGTAAAGVIANEITGAKGVQPFEVPAARDAYAANATQLLQGYVAQIGDRIHIVASLMDPQQRKTIRVLRAEGKPGGAILPLIETVVHQISDDARPFPTRSEAALKEYFLALSSSGMEDRRKHLKLASAADPNFGAAHVGYIQTLAAAGDVNGAKAALAAAVAKASSFSALDRARLNAFQANVNNDPAAKVTALAELARLQPADLEIWKSLAEARMRVRDFPGAVQAFETLLKMAPADAILWNAKAYAHAFANDLEGARKSIDEYKRLAPNEANPSDSLGEIYFYFGRFDEAERAFLEAHQKNAAMLGGGNLYRAALARSLKGDTAAADAQFKKYEEFRKIAGDPLLPLETAIWEYETNRPPAAMARLAQFAASAPAELASLSHAQLAVWYAAAGDASNAKEQLQKAIQGAHTPVAQNLASVARFVTLTPAGAQEWAARALQVLPNPAQAPVRNQLLGHALLLDKKFPDAVSVWRDVYKITDPNSDGEARVMLAWALAKSSQAGEAAKLIEKYPFPSRNPEVGLGTLTIPRLRALKAGSPQTVR
ncbi:MAG TPA: hypothetical protein VMZ52_20815 [Bryobacteraceae bacterium]|nr:hypothetical protein [Bryobacteraceae bacterium]